MRDKLRAGPAGRGGRVPHPVRRGLAGALAGAALWAAAAAVTGKEFHLLALVTGIITGSCVLRTAAGPRPRLRLLAAVLAVAACAAGTLLALIVTAGRHGITAGDLFGTLVLVRALPYAVGWDGLLSFALAGILAAFPGQVGAGWAGRPGKAGGAGPAVAGGGHPPTVPVPVCDITAAQRRAAAPPLQPHLDRRRGAPRGAQDSPGEQGGKFRDFRV